MKPAPGTRTSETSPIAIYATDLDDDALEADEFRRRDAGVFDFEAKLDGFLDPVEKLVE